MRILYKPDRFLGKCNACGTIYDITDEINSKYSYRSADCEVCRQGYVRWVMQEAPKIIVSNSTCSHCGTDVAPGDTHCNKCGAPLKKG